MMNSTYSSYVAAFGLLGLALYDTSQANYQGAVTSLLAALAVFGIHTNIEKIRNDQTIKRHH